MEMDAATKIMVNNVLDNLPLSGTTNYPGMTYEQGIEEVLLYLLGEISYKEFSYSDPKNEA